MIGPEPMSAENPPVIIGTFPWNGWTVEDGTVDLTRRSLPSSTVVIAAEPQRVAIDLARTALIVIDMQHEFCSPGGWVDSRGSDLAPGRAAVASLVALVPELRRHSVPIIWLNWGNRPDRANLPPGVLHVVNPTGTGIGFGDPLPGTGSRVLERDNWSTEIVSELEPDEADLYIHKYRLSGFWDTELDSVLRNLDRTTLLFAGVNVDQCVLATLTDAACIGYDCLLVADCCATTSPEYCTLATHYNVRGSLGFVIESPMLLDALGATAG
ncbi:MAG TPA: isochorismatase family cysteine hydrolase [Acidimicrobiales bacterium]|jgi:nicotinamidase-related amidase|nr:isochorismatase family cysteine hydrolase [Acidimicrobiales bacterium]